MTKRKTVLFGGVILVAASGAFAGQRTRGGESVRGGGTGSVAAPTYQEIAPGVAQRSVNGVTTEANSKNLIGLDDVIAAYGSVQAYKAAMATKSIGSRPGPDGEIILANGVVGLVAGYASPAQLPKTAAELQAEHQTKVSNSSIPDGGVMFADGMVGIGTDERTAASFRTGVPTVMNGDVEVAADGMVRFE